MTIQEHLLRVTAQLLANLLFLLMAHFTSQSELLVVNTNLVFH